MRIVAALACLAIARAATGTPYVGAYFLVDAQGVEKLQALAANAATLPVNRLWVSFVSPSLVYSPGSNTLKNVGLGLTQTGDYGFSILKTAIATLQAGGVEVFLSMGCVHRFAALYSRHAQASLWYHWF